MISTKIRQERRNLKLTQAELSEMLNISQSTLAGYETGAREPDINTIIKFAKIFHCSIDYLVGLENRSTPMIDSWQQDLLDITKEFTEIEKIKLKGYIQGLIDNRQEIGVKNFNNNSFHNSNNNNINF